MSIYNKIMKGFDCLIKPDRTLITSAMSDDEIVAIKELESYRWKEVPLDFLCKNYDVLFLVSPQNFRYYLPVAMLISLEDCVNKVPSDNLILELDRSADPVLWDEYFISRWGLLSQGEIETCLDWVLWLQENKLYDDARLSRVFDTLNLLLDRVS